MSKNIIPILFLILIACNNGGNSGSGSETDSIALKIYIDKEGIITANGNPVSLQTLTYKLDSLQKTNGMIYYSRANPAAEPPANAIMVMQIITNYTIPIKLFADKNFTKPVNPK